MYFYYLKRKINSFLLWAKYLSGFNFAKDLGFYSSLSCFGILITVSNMCILGLRGFAVFWKIIVNLTKKIMKVIGGMHLIYLRDSLC